MALSAVALAALGSSATAAVPPSLLGSTVQAASEFAAGSAAAVSPAVAALTQGVSNVMVLNTLKWVVTLACGVLAATGLSVGILYAGNDSAGSGAAIPAASTSADDKDKPALTGTWTRKEGKETLTFSDKNVLKITPFGDDDDSHIVCEYTVEKDEVKAKITEHDGTGNAKQKLSIIVPVGTEFSFKWKAKDDAAKLDELKGEEMEKLFKNGKLFLEGDFDKQKK